MDYEKCPRCGADPPPGAGWCPMCGKELVRHQQHKVRGNGQGSVYQLPNGHYKAVVTTGYYLDADGHRRRRTRSKVCERKKDAVASLIALAASPRGTQPRTFQELYTAWFPTHRAGKATMDCYKAAMKYLAPIWSLPMPEITVDDLQECLDDCPHGKRTRENMRAVIGLVYKYGIPRKVVPDNLNLAPFLSVTGDAAAHRDALTDVELEKVRQAVGKVPGADQIYMLCYTGFRIREFLSLTADSYSASSQTLTGGSKTAAGRDRTVTLSPKIAPLVAALAASGGPLIKKRDGTAWGSPRAWTGAVFYPALEQIGIDNPVLDNGRRRISPHSCRHTFATLLKRVQGADKDKQELIGHASVEMLRYYQDVALEDLRSITNAI